MEVFGILLIALGAFAPQEECNIACNVDKALRGDGQAALEMAEESTKFQSPEIVEHWYKIAAENGNPQGQLGYAKLLISRSRHRQDCLRANCWLERASAAGESVASNLAKRLTVALRDPRTFENGCKGAL